jgi:hypothetical protein
MININMRTQPNDVTCGPTSLHSIYQYYGDKIRLSEVIKQVSYVKTGGTIASYLGRHALERGYQSKLYTYNLNIFDPSWFEGGKSPADFLKKKLKLQLKYKTGKRFRESTFAYIKYLNAGGEIRFRDLTVNVLKKYFEQNQPIITGLSATYLYQSQREYAAGHRSIYHDLKGTPCGHFVVLCGYDESKRHVIVADPHRENPLSSDNYYKVSINTLINAILLGVITYDANLLIITPSGT